MAHHGDCYGADATFHILALIHEIPVTIHPPIKTDLQAFCRGEDSRVMEKSYFERNRDIVNESDELLACPPYHPLPEKGGTAYTVNYALKQEVPVTIIWPDGSLELYDG